MIPADLATRLRVLIDTELRAIVPIQEVSSDLPTLEPGQRFTATIDKALPDGNFRALVAGRTTTLAMPHGAKAGDILDLVVTSNHDKTITAKLADIPIAANAAPTPKLSSAGQLISQLLTGRHGEMQAASLNRNEPLLSAPPAKGMTLTPLLRQAIKESGLFYEAHQASWVEGETSLESLLREPQARLSMGTVQTLSQGLTQALAQSLTQSPLSSAALQSLAANDTGLADPNDPHAQALPGKNTPELAANDHPQDGARPVVPAKLNAPDTLRTADTIREQTTPTSSLKIAEQLMPIVHQQLETLATHQALWQGQVWPGQTMQWEIFDPKGQNQSSSDQSKDNEPQPWQSTLKLQMPRLGGIEAILIVTGAGVAVRMRTASAQTATQLQEGSSALGSALDAAGVPMTGFVVDRETQK